MIETEMDELTMEDSKVLDTAFVLVVPVTPAKPPRTIKFYTRRKSTNFLHKQHEIDDVSAISPQEINDPQLLNLNSNINSGSSKEEELKETCFSPGDCGFVMMKGSDGSTTTQDDSQGVHLKDEKESKKELDSDIPQGTEKKKNSKVTPKKPRFHRPRILEEGKKRKNAATNRVRTISKRKKKKEKDSEEEAVVVVPETPGIQPLPKRRKTDNTKSTLARTLIFDEAPVLSCLELSRISGPNFPMRKKRMARKRRSIWKTKSKRSNRKKNVLAWANIILPLKRLEDTKDVHSSQSEVSLEIEAPKVDYIVDPIIQQQLSHQKDNDIRVAAPSETMLHNKDVHSSQSEVSLEIEAPKLDSICKKRTEDIVDMSLPVHIPSDIKETLMITTNCVVQKRSRKKSKKVDKFLREEMIRLEKADYSSIEGSRMSSVRCKTPKRQYKRTKPSVEHLIQQLKYQKDHGLLSLADVPLHIEDTLMKSVSDVVLESAKKATKDIAKLIKEMTRLNLNKKVTTTLAKYDKEKNTAKIKLDDETVKEWELLMVNDNPNRSYADEETESKWKKEREIFKSRIDLFISQMHCLQGNKKFKKWKGSVVDSIVGVFLTQNVSDYLSSNAFMSVAARYPVHASEDFTDLAYEVEEPLEVNDSVKSLEFNSEKEGSEAEEHEKPEKKKNKKTGIVEDVNVDWKRLREMYTKEGPRDRMHMDCVDWNNVILSGHPVLANTIKKRGQFNNLARNILTFLNHEVKQNGTVDLEWLRDAPSDLVKRYLLEINGIGLKSTECIRLLGLQQTAFPVDTNVGRIVVRLGWVPLEPLPDGVQMHQLHHYPSMDSIQKFLWPRLCKLSQESLYELHYQMITFGKVFCTKIMPNCNACPMKSECKYFASAYVSSKNLLPGPEETKTHEADTTYPDDDDANTMSNIYSIEEYDSTECRDQINRSEPIVEMPSSPGAEAFELPDIEDTPCRSLCQSYDDIPGININIDALKKNVVDALLRSGKMLKSCGEEISNALVVLTPENACIPIETPEKIKYYNRLRTEHVVYLLPDNHKLLLNFEKRDRDDPSPYLLAIWQPGETSYSFIPPKKKCDSDGSKLCEIKTCSYCWKIREEKANVYRGTILIPCRTAMRGGFPLNGTYFQTNEVFADYETSLEPIVFPREWCDGLERRALYCGSSVSAIFRFVDTRQIQLSFWTGFLCMRAFDRKKRYPKQLVRRLHTQPGLRGKNHMVDE